MTADAWADERYSAKLQEMYFRKDAPSMREMAERLHLPFPVLSDADLALTSALRLPTFKYGDWTLLKRFTMILQTGRIVHVIYPVFPPMADAPAVVTWLRGRAT